MDLFCPKLTSCNNCHQISCASSSLSSSASSPSSSLAHSLTHSPGLPFPSISSSRKHSLPLFLPLPVFALLPFHCKMEVITEEFPNTRLYSLYPFILLLHLLKPLQSGFCPYHATSAVHIKVTSDLQLGWLIPMASCNSSRCFNLSATLDKIDFAFLETCPLWPLSTIPLSFPPWDKATLALSHNSRPEVYPFNLTKANRRTEITHQLFKIKMTNTNK